MDWTLPFYSDSVEVKPVWTRASNNAGRSTECVWACSNALLHFYTVVKPATAHCIHSLLVLAAEQLQWSSWQLSTLLTHITDSFHWQEFPVLFWGVKLAIFQFWSQTNLTNVCFLSHPSWSASFSKAYSYFTLSTDPLHKAYLYPKSLEQIRLPNCQLLYPTQSLSCHP